MLKKQPKREPRRNTLHKYITSPKILIVSSSFQVFRDLSCRILNNLNFLLDQSQNKLQLANIHTDQTLTFTPPYVLVSL